MSVESPKFANHQQQQVQAQQQQQTASSQMQRSSGGQQPRRQLSSGNGKGQQQRQESNQSNKAHQKSNQNAQADKSQAQRVNRKDGHQANERQMQDQKRHQGTGQSYSQSRYVSQKNEKDIKQITKVDLRKLNQLDDTIEEEDLEQQLRAAQAASHAQSRSQSYAAQSRRQEELKVKDGEENSEQSDDSSDMERKMAANNKRNIPSSTYHQISGEELRYELFFAPRNNNKSSHNEYFSYKEMVQMYQAEIKRRWDTRAQIKDRYVFPRMQNRKKDRSQPPTQGQIKQMQQLQQTQQMQSHRRVQSKTPVHMAQHESKAAQQSETPLMDSKGPSQNISLIPSEGKISPTKQRPKQNGAQQQLTKSLTSKDATISTQNYQKSGQNKSSAQHIGQQSQTQGTHFKNAMSSENARKSGRGGQGIEHSHTQSAAVVSIVKSSNDLSKAGLGPADSSQQLPPDNILFSIQSSVVPDSKRERRNQQQIQNMMKYNQLQQQSAANLTATGQAIQTSQLNHNASQKTTQVLLTQQNQAAKIKPQQFQQQQTYHLSRNGNLSDLQKPQIMSMQPQHRGKVESQLLSYGGPINPQLQHGVSQKQMQTLSNTNIKSQAGRSATQMQQHPRHGNQGYIGSNHQQKQSIDSLKRVHQNNRHDSQKHVSKKAINQHYTQYNKSFINKNELGSNGHGKGAAQGGTRNAASIASFKSSKSPAINRPHHPKIVETGNGNISTSSKQQERTMTQQQMHVMAIGEQISQRQTTRSQIKSDQIPQSFTKFKTKAIVNKNSIISLNKYSNHDKRSSQNEEMVGQEGLGQAPGQVSTRAAQRKNLQYQNYKAQIEQGQLVSQGGVSNRKNVAISNDKAGKQSNIQGYVMDSQHQQQMTRMVSNNTQMQKSHDNGSSLVATLEKSDELPRPNNSVSPVKQKPLKQLYHQQPGIGPQQQQQQFMGQFAGNDNNAISQAQQNQQQLANIRQAMSVHKFHNAVNATDQKSPQTNKNNFSHAQVSIFDTSPDSLNFENSKKKQQDLLVRGNSHNFMVPYDESQGIRVTQEQYRTQNLVDPNMQKHGHSQSSDLQRYQSQQQNGPNSIQKHYIINNAVMTHQLDLGNGGRQFMAPQGATEMSVVLEAQRESVENLLESRESAEAEPLGGYANQGSQQHGSSQILQKSQMVVRQPSHSENVAPDLSQESINFIQHQNMVGEALAEQQRQSMGSTEGGRKTIYNVQMQQKGMKKDSKVIQKSIVTHQQTRSMQSIERPASSKSQLRSDKQRKQNQMQQHQSQMFNEYNDTIESINQIKNQRQRSTGINNSMSNFQTDSQAKLQTHGQSKQQKTFSKSSSKQNMPTSQQQLLSQQQQALIANMNNGLTTSAPQANRLIQKQIAGQGFSLNQMIGSRNVNQGLKNINSMKEQRMVGVSSDQIHAGNANLSTLQGHQTQSTITIQPNDMLLGMQKQQQVVGKMSSFKHSGQRPNQNQQSVSIFKPANIIQQTKTSQSASRNTNLLPQNQSSSMIYGGSQGSHQPQGNSTFISTDQANNHSHLGQQVNTSSHQHFHSISSQQELMQNSNSGTQFRRQVMRDGSQQNLAVGVQNTQGGSKQNNGSQGSLITLNMAVNNFPVNTRQINDTNSYYGGVATTSGQPVQSSYSIQIQPKIPKKKRQTNSYSGAVGSNVGGSQSGINVGKLNSGNMGSIGNSYGDGGAGMITSQGMPMSALGQQASQFHSQYQQIVHTSTKSSGNAKHRGKNSASSVTSATSLKQNYQQQSHSHHPSNYVSGYHQMMNAQQVQQNVSGHHHPSSKQNVLAPSSGGLTHANKAKNNALYAQMQQQQQVQHTAPGPISQMGILRNAQMKPKK